MNVRPQQYVDAGAGVLDAYFNRLLPLFVIVGMFASVVLAVKGLRPVLPAVSPAGSSPSSPSAPPVIVLVPDPATGVERRTLSADSLFEFGRSDLKPASRTLLESLAAQIKAAAVQQVVVIGHADRLGSAAVNQLLSDQRAQAVRGVLVSAGIGPAAIAAAGVGNRMPLTRPGDCPGTSDDTATRTCLGKDRRVDIWTREQPASAPR